MIEENNNHTNMTIEEQRSIAQNILQSRSSSIIKFIKNNYPEIYNTIENWCKERIFNYPIEFKFYWFLHNIVDFPKCKVCGKDIVRSSVRIKTGYNGRNINELYCSTPCMHKDPKYNQKRIDTSIKKYGVSHPTKSDSIKNKMKNVFIERYGTDNPMKCDKIKNNLKKTMLLKFGEVTNLKCEETKKKIKNTCIQKYGVDNPMKNECIKKKVFDSCTKTIGYLTVLQNPNFWENQKKNNLERYGVEYYTQTNEFKEKSKNSCLSKYGCEFWIQNKHNLDKHLEQVNVSVQNRIYNRIMKNQNIVLLESLNEFKNNYKNDHLWLCKKCNNEFKKPLNSLLQIPYCPICYPNIGKSRLEIDICNFIKEIIPQEEIIQSDRNILKIINKELDIYIPSKKLAIEFDGLFWHSDTMILNHDYHLIKTDICNKQEIQLIHIFEDEWLYKQDIVKSILKSKLGIFDKTIYARQCEIKEVDYNQTKDFLIENHIQGFCNYSISYGLYYNDELVSVMTFGGYRLSTGRKPIDDEYELLRFCNKLSYHIPGGASKLFKHFMKNYGPKKIISYCDRRWFCGNVYIALGFKFSKVTDPSYWYFKQEKSSINRFNRFVFRKSELSKLLDDYDSNKTEYENMLNNGYSRIWDCGNFLFEFSNKVKD